MHACRDFCGGLDSVVQILHAKAGAALEGAAAGLTFGRTFTADGPTNSMTTNSSSSSLL
jgi:hypothetical protein